VTKPEHLEIEFKFIYLAHILYKNNVIAKHFLSFLSNKNKMEMIYSEIYVTFVGLMYDLQFNDNY